MQAIALSQPTSDTILTSPIVLYAALNYLRARASNNNVVPASALTCVDPRYLTFLFDCGYLRLDVFGSVRVN